LTLLTYKVFVNWHILAITNIVFIEQEGGSDAKKEAFGGCS
jgi:hypothetical protein